jgi:hypothetical protein
MSALHLLERPLRASRKSHGHRWMVDGNDAPTSLLDFTLTILRTWVPFWELLFIDFWGS